jgi:hypothetical protein
VAKELELGSFVYFKLLFLVFVPGPPIRRVYVHTDEKNHFNRRRLRTKKMWKVILFLFFAIFFFLRKKYTWLQGLPCCTSFASKGLIIFRAKNYWTNEQTKERKKDKKSHHLCALTGDNKEDKGRFYLLEKYEK